MSKPQKPPELADILNSDLPYYAERDYLALMRGKAPDKVLKRCFQPAYKAYRELLKEGFPKHIMDGLLRDISQGPPKVPSPGEAGELARKAEKLAFQLDRFINRYPSFNSDATPPVSRKDEKIVEWRLLAATPASLRSWANLLNRIEKARKTLFPKGLRPRTLRIIALAEAVRHFTGKPHYPEIVKLINACFPKEAPKGPGRAQKTGSARNASRKQRVLAESARKVASDLT